MNFVGLDIETTGLDMWKKHRLIQIGIAFHRQNVICHDVQPWGIVKFDPEAMKVNGFTEERVAAAEFQMVIDNSIYNELMNMGHSPNAQLTPVGWNVGPFDLPFVKAELPRTAKFFSHRVVDLSSIAMFLAGGSDDWRKRKDEGHKTIEEILGEVKWHDAGYDALAALIQWDTWIRGYGDILRMCK